jgi:hypothetical protein
MNSFCQERIMPFLAAIEEMNAAAATSIASAESAEELWVMAHIRAYEAAAASRAARVRGVGRTDDLASHAA